MIRIDGSMGEGGGQVLRTAVTLAMITGESLTIANIRAGRRKPGLMRQHLTAVKAAEEIAGARVDGDFVGSTELEFKPGRIRHGSYHFAVGTAGSATLVLQTVLPALLATEGESHLVLEGGTHNPLAPPFDFLDQTFLPLLRRMGAGVEARLKRHGFFPAGGGKFAVSVRGGKLSPLSLLHRSGEPGLEARCVYSGIADHIAVREAGVLGKRLHLDGSAAVVQKVDSPGPGNAVMVTVKIGNDQGGEIREVFTAFGERGVTAEKVAARAAEEALAFAEAPALLGPHTADQILLPLALAGGGEFATLAPTQHAETNMEVIRQFLPVAFAAVDNGDKTFIITCKG